MLMVSNGLEALPAAVPEIECRDGAADAGQGRRQAYPAMLVEIVGNVARRGEVVDALADHCFDRLLHRAAILEERFVEIAEVVDDDLTAGIREHLDAGGEIRFAVVAGVEIDLRAGVDLVDEFGHGAAFVSRPGRAFRQNVDVARVREVAGGDVGRLAAVHVEAVRQDADADAGAVHAEHGTCQVGTHRDIGIVVSKRRAGSGGQAAEDDGVLRGKRVQHQLGRAGGQERLDRRVAEGAEERCGDGVGGGRDGCLRWCACCFGHRPPDPGRARPQSSSGSSAPSWARQPYHAQVRKCHGKEKSPRYRKKMTMPDAHVLLAYSTIGDFAVPGSAKS